MAAEQQQLDPLHKGEFSNWAKAVLSLQNARDGSINFIKREMEQFVEELQRMHGSDIEEHFKELLFKVAVHGKVKGKNKDRFSLDDDSCTTCVEIFEKQLNEFEESRWHSKKWIPYSTEKQIDPSSYWWVVAKMYIANSNFVDAEGPEEVDPSAIFKLLLNCKLFDDKMINECADKLVELRNKLMHSANNRLTRQEMIESFALIKEFLNLVADDKTEVINEVEKLEKSAVVLFEENGEFSKLAKEALQLQNISLNADLESPEGIKRVVIKSLGASNLEIKQQEMKFEKLRKEKEGIQRRCEESEKKVDQYRLLGRRIHRKLSGKEINVRVDSDVKKCSISNMCQMSDGTVVVIDEANNKLKRLDDNFNVRDFCQIDSTSRSIVPVSSTQVAILSKSWKIDLMTLGESIVQKTIDLKIEDKSKSFFGFEYCNDRFWIHGRNGIYIYSSSGSMFKFIENELYGGIDGKHPSCSSLCTNKDKKRVYATTGSFVYAFDTKGERLLTLNIPTRESYPTLQKHSCPVITTVGNDFILLRSNDLFSDDDCIYDMEGNTLFVFFTGKGKVPQSLLYDEKKCCLIVAFEDNTISDTKCSKIEVFTVTSSFYPL